MKFEAVIDGVHFDPKKGSVKIVLVGVSHVSLDELTTLSPKDESIQVTLESEQTKIDALLPSVPNLGEHYRDEGHEDQSHEGPSQEDSLEERARKAAYPEEADRDDVPADEVEEGEE
jgi:hypothetical protein